MKETSNAGRWGRRRRTTAQSVPPAEEPRPSTEEPLNAAAVQIMAHTLIAELFGAGLRVQNLTARAPDDLQQDLSDIADQIDKVISELRTFAFTHRG